MPLKALVYEIFFKIFYEKMIKDFFIFFYKSGVKFFLDIIY